ncbi:hypothetical protein A1F97_11099, partial [Pyrenophora tritici-repentis]
MAPTYRGFADGDERPQQTLVPSFKRKRARSGKDRATWAYNHILQLERQKLFSKPEVERMQLERFLEHPEVNQLDDGSVPFRFLYLTIGSSQTLMDFSDQLRVARDTQNRLGVPLCSPSSISETFNTICRLDTTEATCILLKRYYAIKLLEEEEEEEYHGLNSEDIPVETPETMSKEGTTQVGNPTVIRDAALIDRQTSKIRPDAQPGSREFLIIRRKVKRIRQLAKRLRGLTNLYGIGILALLPSGSSFSGFSVTDAMLLAMSEQRFGLFIRLLHREQGQLLKGLSEAVAPALTTLATFGLGHQIKFDFEKVDL